jgi:hypothetical protein
MATGVFGSALSTYNNVSIDEFMLKKRAHHIYMYTTTMMLTIDNDYTI